MTFDRRSIITALTCLPIQCAAKQEVQDFRSSSAASRISRKSFGIHLVGVTGWDQVDNEPTLARNFGCQSVRIWDTGATWRLIQPAAHVFDWSALDSEISIWERHFDDILFCFGQAPDWATGTASGKGSYNPSPPKSDEDVRLFIKALLTRYPVISAVQIWNEPNFPHYFNGTVEQLAHISRVVASAVHETRPNVCVVAAAPQPYADRGFYFSQYLDALNRNNAAKMIDVLAYHTYVQPREPEIMGPMIDHLNYIAIKKGFSQPVWSTEFGWGIYRDSSSGFLSKNNKMRHDQATSYILRGFLVSLGHGLQRQYFYAADKEFSALSLFSKDKKRVSPAGAALERLTDLLDGGLIGRPILRSNHFEQLFTRSDGRSGLIAWTSDNVRASLPLRPGMQWKSFLDETVPVNPDGTVSLGPIPIYLA